MRSFVVISLLLVTASGCAVVKTPSISGINRDEGKIQMTYNYGALERPQVKWDEVLASANNQCKSWGYQDAQQTSAPQSTCIQNNQQGNCISWKVDTLYDCRLSPEQQASLNEKKQKAIQLQQEEKQKEEKAKQKLLNNLSDSKAVFACVEDHPGSGIAKTAAKNIMKVYISGDDSYYASILKSYKCQSISKSISSRSKFVTDGTVYHNDGSNVYIIYSTSIKEDGNEISYGIVAR